MTRSTAAGRYPSIRDVARAAGVSHQTVSRVLNDLPDVAPATRNKVLDSVRKLGYRRNLTARNLATQRSTTIGIVTDDSPRLGPVNTLMALEKVAREQGANCSVVTIADPYAETIPAALRGLEEVGVHGIVVIASLVSAAAVVRKTRVRVPVVLLATGEDSSPGVIAYGEDQDLGARIATQHLLRLGHTDIAHIAGSTDWFDGRTRLRGWTAEMVEAGLPATRWYESDWSPGFAYDLAQKMITEDLPTAIFAASDHMALGVLRAFAENQVRVPDQVSVIGYDDAEGSDFYYPPLTTVRQDFQGVATRAWELLHNPNRLTRSEEPPAAPTLKLRSSTTRRRAS